MVSYLLGASAYAQLPWISATVSFLAATIRDHPKVKIIGEFFSLLFLLPFAHVVGDKKEYASDTNWSALRVEGIVYLTLRVGRLGYMTLD